MPRMHRIDCPAIADPPQPDACICDPDLLPMISIAFAPRSIVLGPGLSPEENVAELTIEIDAADAEELGALLHDTRYALYVTAQPWPEE